MRAPRPLFPLLFYCSVGGLACGGWGGGTSWLNEPLVPEEERAPAQTGSMGQAGRPAARTIGQASVAAARPADKESRSQPEPAAGGRVLGTFRNTYYDFPQEGDYVGERVALKSDKCETIAMVPRGFHDAVCVQGSGLLARGTTVSFSRRDCGCAEVCPRTNQRICFDSLERSRFPWGRGAAGGPITPLRSVAADTQVLPMGTVLYIPELDGVSRGDGQSPLDGCFVVEDRGLKVQGEHVDIFTGHPAQTAALNAQVPSNRGVTVVVDVPKCAHLIRR